MLHTFVPIIFTHLYNCTILPLLPRGEGYFLRYSTILLGFFCFLFLHCPSLSAQPITTDDDYDVLVVPVGGSSAVQAKDLSGSTLDEMGLFIQSIPGYSLGQFFPSTNQIQIHLKAGEGIQIWSSAIPVSATSVIFSCTASAQGERPQQAAIAILDGSLLSGTFNSNLGVSIALNEEIPFNRTEDFSYEYRSQSDSIVLLLQFVGPISGESIISLGRLRMLAGYREMDFTLGSTALTLIEHFGSGISQVSKNPSSTLGGKLSICSENHTIFPNTPERSLLLESPSASDVIQAGIPLKLISPLVPEARIYPQRIYGEAYVKRIQGEHGILSVALFSGATYSGGYTEYPIRSIPMNEWLRVESPMTFTQKGAELPLFIIQIRDGEAQIAVDDVSLQGRNDSPYFWRADYVKTATPSLIPSVSIPEGTFHRGSKLIYEGGEIDPNIDTAYLDELPQREITVSAFRADRYEVSNQDYYRFWQDPNGGNQKQHTPGADAFGDSWPNPVINHPDYPVVSIEWEDAMAYCDWRTGYENPAPPSRYRLPTEAEWEYMARGTTIPGETPQKYPWGFIEPSQTTDKLANYSGFSDGFTFTAPVTEFEAGKSPLGILNLGGNVWEWCLDIYDSHYYDPLYFDQNQSPNRDPMGPDNSSGSSHTIRGGSWNNPPENMRTANRVSADGRIPYTVGFRCVLSAVQPTSGTPKPTPTPLPTPQNTPTPSVSTPTPLVYIPGNVYRSALGIDMMYVPTGNFLRGNDTGDDLYMSNVDEPPRRTLTISAFLLDRYEVSVAWYKQYVDETGAPSPPSLNDLKFNAPDYPIVMVTYQEALDFCNWRTNKELLPPSQAYRLPTEAEWEYAARGSLGLKTGEKVNIWPWGTENPLLNGIYKANLQGTSDGFEFLAPISSFSSWKSPFNVLNLAGNAAEWCSDWYNADYYKMAPNLNPPGPNIGTVRVVRGGSWQSDFRSIRCAARDAKDPTGRFNTVGFRCIRNP